ncbi:RsmE family RNA methyltransferase [Neisseria elongata]|uniref:RsmE family RNA methyltransferase n=1 Tax=Neisseria elongata TaxID=495 RepID=UPI003B97925A
MRHLNVLRCRIGEGIVLFNGDGLSYHAVLNSLDKRAAEAEISSSRPSENESPLHITLIQAVSSGERMDFTLQKSVELGVNEIIPVESARSVVKLSGERAEKRAPRRRLSRRHAPSTAKGGSSRIRLSAWVCGAAANSNPTAANHNTVGPPSFRLKNGGG